jgi:hypothetical protein
MTCPRTAAHEETELLTVLKIRFRVRIPTKSKTRNAEFIYCFICRLKKRMKTAGPSGGLIRQALIPGLFLMGPSLRSRTRGAQEIDGRPYSFRATLLLSCR